MAGGIRQVPDDSRTDDQAIGYGGQQTHMLWPTDAEADADWKRCPLTQPIDPVDQASGEFRPLTGDPGYRNKIEKARGTLGDPYRPLRRGGGSYELDQAEVALPADGSQRAAFLDQ